MQPFSKLNDLVDKCAKKEGLISVSVILNKDKIKQCKYGKFCAPIDVIYKYENGDAIEVKTPDYLIKVPSSQEDCIEALGTQYCALIVNAKDKKEYTGGDNQVHYDYDCKVGVIRNYAMIEKCRTIEKSAYAV